MPLVILHHLLNVFAQLVNKRGFKKIFYLSQFSSQFLHLSPAQKFALHMTVAHHGMCPIRLSEGIIKHQKLNKKSAATALNTMLASAHTQMAQ
jgi:hypothetical protein